jgi:hypothetical protein
MGDFKSPTLTCLEAIFKLGGNESAMFAQLIVQYAYK